MESMLKAKQSLRSCRNRLPLLLSVFVSYFIYVSKIAETVATSRASDFPFRNTSLSLKTRVDRVGRQGTLLCKEINMGYL